MKKLMRYSVLIAAIFISCGCSSNVKQIFNGTDLEGWEVLPSEQESHWKVEEGGILMGENMDKKGSIIWTEDTYGDIELTVEYRTQSDDYDSGIFLHGEGHQVQIGISRSLQRDMTACIYAPVDGKGPYPGQTDKILEYHHPGDWNKLRIIVEGNRIRTFLNGNLCVDYNSVELAEAGPIGLQLHAGVHMAIEFRNIELREINS
ncbi:MAG: DUF1080 domain-containing protein [Bacteroidales bacterium]|nr:DUF1080 domain-containing protein [Bacteroidales bacterium]